ncbi:glycoside hydrolase family 3 C-terminal domain-containing protein [Tessaracoccus sp. MC1627]|uniref:glycoside hydrolase family 3 N-terminal domain-containing protein n=1 Tax=Tessaracoccus sp. MC1627 TaxID=2760312 RepID=UPI001601D856|nr:glycoside hydrolase family 3 N-terminal domain-containing protein [Tessaracoccus sp. MC1627]MBB1511086.1 glycoside hydrolase family 3 C-terminal domain-containing protein [Tessaracoccus sp. MC1627]
MTTLDEARPEDRAAALLEVMSLDEKMAQVSCYFPADITDTSDFEEKFPHGIGQVSCLEARSAETLEEVAEFQRRVQSAAMAGSDHDIPAIFHMEGLCGAFLPAATSFPAGIGRASSWNPDLEERVGAIVGRQERAVGITHTLAPVLDISRDSRMGRQGETYGEDPTLAAELGVAFVRGLQGRDRAGLRTEAVAKHFLGFHHSEGGIHGAHCDIPDRLLLEVYAKPFQAAISTAGLRGIMPSYNSIAGEPASSSLRILTRLLRDQMGFDGVTVSDYGAIGNLHLFQGVAESFAHAGLAAMEAGMDTELHVPQGFGPGLREWFATGRADIAILDRAVHRVLTTKFRMGLFEHPFALMGDALHAEFSSDDDKRASLQSARESIVLLRNDGVLPLASGIRRLAVIGCHAKTARFFFGGYTHFSMAEGKLAAVASMAGLAGGGADRAIERTVPGTGIQADDDPVFEELMQKQQPHILTLLDELRQRLPGTEVNWAQGYPIAGDDDSGYEEALALAEQADLILMTMGGKHGTSSIASMGEGIDATDINLPPCQEELIRLVALLGKPIVGVHLDGRPVSSDAADAHANALMEAWSPAEHGAQAIVDVLLGEVNPSGRLPVSVARSAGQIPIYYNHPNGSAWHQGDSIGFPDYVDAPHTPRYRFGHGLSYTRFEYSDLSVASAEGNAPGKLEVTALVHNVGERAGTDVVQLYVRDPYASVSRPVQELAGFRRVHLEPAESARVRFTLALSQLAFLDRDMNWLSEAGDIEIRIGRSSEDIQLREVVRIPRDTHVECSTRAFFAESHHAVIVVSTNEAMVAQPADDIETHGDARWRGQGGLRPL